MQSIQFLKLAAVTLALGTTVTACSDDEDSNEVKTPAGYVDAASAKFIIAATDSIKDLQGGTTVRVLSNLNDASRRDVVVYDSLASGNDVVHVQSGLALFNWDNANRTLIGGVYRKGGGVLKSNGYYRFAYNNGGIKEVGRAKTDGYGNAGYFNNYVYLSNTGKPEVYVMDNAGNSKVINVDYKNYLVNGAAPSVATIVPYNGGVAMQLSYADRDSAVIAFADNDLKINKLIATGAAGQGQIQRKGSRYGQMAFDAKGDLYLFGGTAKTDERFAAVRVKKGTTEFDGTYNFNLNKALDGRRIMKVHHIVDSKFFVELFNAKGAEGVVGVGGQGDFGILDMAAKTFTKVSLPNALKLYVGTPSAANGKIYVPISGGTGIIAGRGPAGAVTDAPSQKPTIYVVDGATGAVSTFMTLKGGIIKGIAIVK